MSKSRVYFACEPINLVGRALAGRIKQCLNSEREKKQRSKYALGYAHYYGDDTGSGSTMQVLRDGAQGELSKLRISDARALAKALKAILTGPKLNWRPQAANTDASVRGATTLALNVLEMYWKQRRMSEVCSLWAEQAIAMSEGFIFHPWDMSLGRPFAAVDDEMVSEGDVSFLNVLPWNVLRDVEAESWHLGQWNFTKVLRNRYDLAKRHPLDTEGNDAEERILGTSSLDEMREATGGDKDYEAGSDLVPVWYFYHDRTPSLPSGRAVTLLSGSCVLTDTTLKGYPRRPLKRFASDEMLGTPFGYTSWWDALGIQDVTDGLHSAVVSNQLTLATQSIAMEEGTRCDPDSTHGLKVFYYTAGRQPPQALQLTKSPPEVFAYIKELRQMQQQNLGLNDTARGNAERGLSGEAYALLASMAIQQNSPLQGSFVSAVAELGTDLLAILAANATTERKVSITGKNSAFLYDERAFTGKDLRAIERVIVDVGNPLEQTPAGRYDLAKLNLQQGFITQPEHLQQVLDTGRLEPAMQAIRNEQLLVTAENEALAKGENPPVHAFQNHILHGKENASVLSNPAALLDVAVINAVQAHFEGHYREFFGIPEGMDVKMDPQWPVRMRLLLGQEPPLPDPMMGGAPGAPPPPGPGAPSSATPPPAPGSQSASDGPAPGLPGMPTNPATGNNYDPTTGGGMVPPPA
jgi:hypothetical protein